MVSSIKIIAQENSQERVDVFLTKELEKVSSSFSRSKVQKLISSGHVSHGERPVKSGSNNVLAGEYAIFVPVENHNIVPFDFTLDVVYEDEDLAVINKPAGLTVHPAHDYHKDTLVNALVKYFGDNLSSVNGNFKPGIVHRLDRNTSGLMVVAKNDASHMHLSRQLEDRSLSRVYYALCFGVPAAQSGTIHTKIDRMRADRTKMIVTRNSGREAVTLYQLKEAYGEYASLIECRLKTGRTHQIRVHLSHLGHSVIGDQSYGHNKRKLTDIEKAIGGKINMERQALHSKSISFIHPRSGEQLSFSSELPSDMTDLINLMTKEE